MIGLAKIALQSRLLGAELLGLSNLIVVQGDKMTERDNTQAVAEYTSTGLVEAIAQMNSGVDFRGVNLRAPTDFCIGAALDLGRGVESEARLAYRRVLAGAHFFITQPVFNPAVITEFNAAYEELAGAPLGLPVFWGLQILMADGVLFSNVPEDLKRDLSQRSRWRRHRP